MSTIDADTTKEKPNPGSVDPQQKAADALNENNKVVKEQSEQSEKSNKILETVANKLQKIGEKLGLQIKKTDGDQKKQDGILKSLIKRSISTLSEDAGHAYKEAFEAAGWAGKRLYDAQAAVADEVQKIIDVRKQRKEELKAERDAAAAKLREERALQKEQEAEHKNLISNIDDAVTKLQMMQNYGMDQQAIQQEEELKLLEERKNVIEKEMTERKKFMADIIKKHDINLKKLEKEEQKKSKKDEKNNSRSIITAIRETGKQTISNVKKNGENAALHAKELISHIKNGVGKVLTGIWTGLKNIVTVIKDIWQFTRLLSVITPLLPVLFGAVTVGLIGLAIYKFAPMIGDAIKNSYQSAVDYTSRKMEDLINLARDTWDKLVTTVKDKLDEFIFKLPARLGGGTQEEKDLVASGKSIKEVLALRNAGIQQAITKTQATRDEDKKISELGPRKYAEEQNTKSKNALEESIRAGLAAKEMQRERNKRLDKTSPPVFIDASKEAVTTNYTNNRTASKGRSQQVARGTVGVTR